MSDHDPLCWMDSDSDTDFKCSCFIIAEARADERERIAQAIEADLNMLVAAPGYRIDLGTGMIRAARIARTGGRDE